MFFIYSVLFHSGPECPHQQRRVRDSVGVEGTSAVYTTKILSPLHVLLKKQSTADIYAKIKCKGHHNNYA